MSQNEWSDWVNFDFEECSKIPESPGVYMCHSNMKILFIGGSKNLKKATLESLSDGAISNAKRIRFMIEENFEETSKEIVNDFKKRHEGQLPICMN